MRQHPLFFLESLDRRIANRAKFRGTSDTFLKSRNPKLVVIGILLHIGLGVLAPAGSFFAKKNSPLHEKSMRCGGFLGGDFINTPIESSRRDRCRSPPLTPPPVRIRRTPLSAAFTAVFNVSNALIPSALEKSGLDSPEVPGVKYPR